MNDGDGADRSDEQHDVSENHASQGDAIVRDRGIPANIPSGQVTNNNCGAGQGEQTRNEHRQVEMEPFPLEEQQEWPGY
jgi:hypothetical protein